MYAYMHIHLNILGILGEKHGGKQASIKTIYIYIHIYMGEKNRGKQASIKNIHICIYIYIYMYVSTHIYVNILLILR